MREKPPLATYRGAGLPDSEPAQASEAEKEQSHLGCRSPRSRKWLSAKLCVVGSMGAYKSQALSPETEERQNNEPLVALLALSSSSSPC